MHTHILDINRYPTDMQFFAPGIFAFFAVAVGNSSVISRFNSSQGEKTTTKKDHLANEKQVNRGRVWVCF